MDLSPWEKKTVTLEWAGLKLPFRVAQELFSSHEIDQGTKLLLRSLDLAALPADPVVLDFGCGYGPLGLAVKARTPTAKVVLIDRDALAVAFAALNARELRFPDVEAHGGLDFGNAHAPDGYDLILWNVPGKAGEPVLRGLIDDIPRALRPGGLLALVVVIPLANALMDAISAHSALTLIANERHTAHTVLHARRTADGANARPLPDTFERGLFDRPVEQLEWNGVPYTLRPVIGLPEYDGPNFVSAIQMEMIDAFAVDRPIVRLVLDGVGQGHGSIRAAHRLAPESIRLVDRDLLALLTTARNLAANGVPVERIQLDHVPLLDAPTNGLSRADLIVTRLDSQLSLERLAVQHSRLRGALRQGGSAIVAGPSTSVSRLLRVVAKEGDFKPRSRTRRSGASAASMTMR